MISIIVPSFNNSRYLYIALESILNQSFDKSKYEVIIVDNGSTDDTKKVVNKLINNNTETSIKYIFDSVPGQLTGRHRGVHEANGEILVFIDSDIIADTNWLSAISETFKDSSVMLVGGKSLPNYEVDPPRWLEWFWNRNGSINICGHLSLIDYGNEMKEIDPIYVWGLNFSIRKSSLFELGGFHPDVIPKKYQHFQGDGETGLTIKAKEHGMKAIYQPKALVYHWVPQNRMTYEYFDKRCYYQGICDSYTSLFHFCCILDGEHNNTVEISHAFLLSNVFFHLHKVLKLLQQIQSDYEKPVRLQYHVIKQPLSFHLQLYLVKLW